MNKTLRIITITGLLTVFCLIPVISQENIDYAVSASEFKKAATKEWSLSTTGKATFYPGNTLDLVRKIKNNDKLVLQCTPYSSNPVTAVFDIRGLKQEADAYMSDLKW